MIGSYEIAEVEETVSIPNWSNLFWLELSGLEEGRIMNVSGLLLP